MCLVQTPWNSSAYGMKKTLICQTFKIISFLQNNLTRLSSFNTEVYSSFVSYLYQSGYYSYLIKVGLGLGENTCVALALFNLYLLGCQS